MTNAVVHKFEREQKKIGRYLMGVLSGAFCIPESQFKALRSANNRNVRGGFHLSEVYVNQNGALRARSRQNISERAGLALLGAGEDGTVYIGHFASTKNDPVAIKIGNKRSLAIESKVMKAVEKLSPHVQHLYMYRTPEQCAFEATKRRGGNPLMNSLNKNFGIMYSEYANGGSLEFFIKNYGKALTPAHIKTIVFQVLWTLHVIMSKYPTFRHCDLSLANIFIDLTVPARGRIEYKPGFSVPQVGIRAIIGDFANSHINKKGFYNPSVKSGEHKNDFGIFNGMSSRYDAHLFLTQLGEFLREAPAAKEFMGFLKDCIPKKYMPTASGKSAQLVAQRLRPDSDAVKDIPPVFGMLKHPYFSEFRVEAMSGSVMYRWPRNNEVTAILRNAEKPRIRRVVKRPLRPEMPVEINAEYNELGVGVPLSQRIKGNSVNAARRKMLLDVLVMEKMNETPSLTLNEATNLVKANLRGERLPKARGRPLGFQNFLKARKLGTKNTKMSLLEPMVPKKARSLNRKSPSKKKPKKTGSAPKVMDTTKIQRKKKIPLNKRRFLIPSNNGNESVSLFNQMVELRKRGMNVPDNMRMGAAPIRMMPKAKAKVLAGAKTGVGPPVGMRLSEQKRWWKDQLSIVNGELKISGQKCDGAKVKVDTLKTIMGVLGKKIPPKSKKSDLCALIKMKIAGNNSNSNSNNNSNNNNNNEPVRRKRPSPKAKKPKTPITFEEASRRLRERTAAAKAAKKQTKIKRVKPAKVFPL